MGKNKTYTIVTLLLVLTGVATGLYLFISVLGRDKTPPVITMESDMLQVPVSHSREDLMQGITARDEHDADVTQDIVIEQISNIHADHTAKITYAAFDKAGNVSKASRTLSFSDYRSPRFGQKKPLVFPQGTAPDVLQFLTAEDAMDGDISSYIKATLISDTIDLTHAGEHQVEFRVTNSMGDTAKITLPVDVYDSEAYNATLELSDYLVYIEKGDSFRGQDYLTELKAGQQTYSLNNPADDVKIIINNSSKSPADNAKHIIHITMEDDVDPNVPGVYSVKFHVTMDDYTGYTRLNVVVED